MLQPLQISEKKVLVQSLHPQQPCMYVMFFFVVIKHQILFHTWDSSYYINIQNATTVYGNEIYSLSYVCIQMVFSFRQGCVGLEDDPTCGKLLTTPNPGSLKIHELMARGHQTTPKSIKYQLHINQKMNFQIHGGSAMHLFHCLKHKLILIPPCQCRATWPITAEWYRPGNHTIHMTS